MRQKSTIGSLEYHNQFQDTPDEIRLAKEVKAERVKKDERQGLSKFRVEKVVKK